MRTKCLLLLLIVSLLLPMSISHAQDGGSIQATVAVYELNVRAEPSTTREIVGTLYQGTTVIVQGAEALKDNGGVWVYVSTDTLAGWVLSDYLTMGITPNDLPLYYGLPTPAHTFIVQASQREDLPLYAEANPNSAHVATIPSGSLLTVHVTPDTATDEWGYIQRDNGFVYVTWLRSGLSGWFLDNRIHYPYAYRDLGSYGNDIAFPYPFQGDELPTTGIPVQGQVIGYIIDNSGGGPTNLRQLPNRTAPVVTATPAAYKTWCIVHGRTSNVYTYGEYWDVYYSWLYVTLIGDNTISGWVRRAYVRLPPDYRTDYLPILEEVETPALYPSVEPLTSVDAVADVPLEIYATPNYSYYDGIPPKDILPAQTPFSVIGINIEHWMYQIRYNGGEGWIEVNRWYNKLDLPITFDWFRLPVLG